MPIPRKLSRKEQRERNAKSSRAREAFTPYAESLKKAERGKLADFKLFGLVATVWLAAQRERPRKPPKDEAAWQVEHERMADLVMGGSQLAKRLVEALIKDEPQTFRNVADAIELLRQKPFVGERVAPFDRLDRAILSHLRTHGAGNIEQLRKAISKQMRWKLDRNNQLSPANEKQLRRRCETLEVKIAKSKPGPKSKR
jgi:hypothetical protein